MLNPIKKNETAKQLCGESSGYKTLDNELWKNNEYMENLFNHANVPIIIWDSKFKIIRLNYAFESLLGHKSKEMSGKSVETLFPANQAPNSMEHIKKALIGKRWKTIEIDILHRDGSIRALLWNSATIFSKDNKTPIGTIAQGLDITDRKKAEAELKLSNQRLESILGATKTGLDIIDSNFNIIYIDKEWRNIYGSYKELKCYEYFMNRNSMCPTCGIPEALRTKKPVVTENVLLPKEKNRPIQIITLPFQDEKKEWMVAEVKIDISERKKAEKTIKSSLSELEEQRKLLEQKNIAFRELIKTIEVEKTELKDHVMANVNKVVMPLVKKLKLAGAPAKYVDLIEHNLMALTSSFGSRITDKALNLTPREIEICDLIKDGLTTKEISVLLNTSPLTIDKQRKNIRHKLGISGKDTNIITFLRNL